MVVDQVVEKVTIVEARVIHPASHVVGHLECTYISIITREFTHGKLELRVVNRLDFLMSLLSLCMVNSP
jgi:hypothetical protein